MAKRNRRRATYRLKPASLGIAALLVVMAAPWVLYCLVNLCNEQVSSQIKVLERDYASQEEALRRHTMEWNRMTEPKRLDEALERNGLKLSYAPPERSVIVASNGVTRVPAALQASLEEERIARTTTSSTRTVAQTSGTVRRGARTTRR